MRSRATVAGLHPHRVLPVVLDVGTDDHELLNDDLYLKGKRPRVRGEEYDAFIERCIRACEDRFPKACIYFEDFGVGNTRRILDQYTPQIARFNDDVRNAIVSAGSGIADQIRDAIAVEEGKSKDEAGRQISCIDKQSPLLDYLEHLAPAQQACVNQRASGVTATAIASRSSTSCAKSNLTS